MTGQNEELRNRIAALFRDAPGEERPGDWTPGEIADLVLGFMEEEGLLEADARLGEVRSYTWLLRRRRGAQVPAADVVWKLQQILGDYR